MAEAMVGAVFRISTGFWDGKKLALFMSILEGQSWELDC